MGRSRLTRAGASLTSDDMLDAGVLVAVLNACGSGPVLYRNMRRVAYSLRDVSCCPRWCQSQLTHTRDLIFACPSERSAGRILGSSQSSSA